ncbi:hypothetical protein EYF80_041455 [Liparis tanakae]|uniref:Uncharacterized protein n=1 Tax=Liparis tanakae TaxID=230148 RepID=A0A4Z2G434_9TELE|nr:hypothetical protein EYF80_041455 [Liparis tanakae]
MGWIKDGTKEREVKGVKGVLTSDRFLMKETRPSGPFQTERCGNMLTSWSVWLGSARGQILTRYVQSECADAVMKRVIAGQSVEGKRSSRCWFEDWRKHVVVLRKIGPGLVSRPAA